MKTSGKNVDFVSPEAYHPDGVICFWFRVMYNAWTKGHFIMSPVTGQAPLPEEFFGLIIWEMLVGRDEI